MIRLNWSPIFIIIFLLSISLFSCSEDDPVQPQEEHFEAIGMVFESSGIRLASILRGVTEDILEAPEEGMSEHINIKFYDEDENIIDPPTDEDKSLAWEIDDPSILSIWQHEGEEGGFEFHLKGESEGETYIEFFVNHNDHHDYRSGKIPVHVEHEDGTHGPPVGFELEDESHQLLVSVNNDNVTGSLSISSGTTTQKMTLEFVDENGVHFQPAVPPHSLKIDISDSNVISATIPDTTEPWTFQLNALSTGNAQVTIKIMHDDSVGKEFVPLNIVVN